AVQLLAAIVRGKSTANPNESPDLPVLIREVAELIGSRQQPGEINDTLKQLFGVADQSPQADSLPGKILLAGLNGLGVGLTRRGKSLSTIVESDPTLKPRLQKLFDEAAQRAGSADLEVAARTAALGTLQFADFATAGEVLLRLAVSDASQEVR